jgi:hypothetical protein
MKNNKLEYIIQLIKDKIDHKSNLGYSEIFKLCFNKEYSSDNARKYFYRYS